MSETWQALVGRLFREKGGQYRGYARARTHRPQDADEIVQKAFQRMLEVPDSRAIRNPEGYLHTIVHNLLVERGKASKRERAYIAIDDPMIDEQLADMPDIEGEMDTERRVERLKQVILEMPARWQAAVSLCHMHGMSYEEAASKLGVSVNSIKKYLKKALAYCRRRMLEAW